MKHRRRPIPQLQGFFSGLTVFLAFGATLVAQNIHLSGTVEDRTGGVLVGVTVRLEHKETGRVLTALTEEDGRYFFLSLSPGVYRLSAELPGFRTSVLPNLRLTLGRRLDLPIVLDLVAVDGEVTVSSVHSRLDTLSGELSTLTDEAQIAELPLNGRDWIRLSELHPGVVRARSVAFSSSGNMPTGRIAVAGQRPNATNFLLDGTDINVYSQTRPPGSVSQGLVLGIEAVREFRIVTNNYNAEYGAKSGGLIEVISKSGGSELHGSAYYYHRNDRFDARDFFEPGPVPDFRRHQFGLSLGGPLVGQNTFFFANFEGLRERKGQTSTGVVPSHKARQGYLPDPESGELELVGVAPQVRPFLELFPEPSGPTLGGGQALWSGNEQRRLKEHFVTLRVDHDRTSQDSWFARYSFDEGSARLPYGGSSPFPGFSQSNVGLDHLASLSGRYVFSPTLLNELRLGFSRRVREASPENPTPNGLSFSLVPGGALGQVRIAGLGTVGNTSRPVVDLAQNVFHLTDTVTWQRGRHFLRMGVDIRRFHLNSLLEVETNGVIGFPNLRSFLTASPESFNGVLPGADFGRGLRFGHFGFFAQNTVRLHPRLTADLGVRYEPWTNPTEVNGKLTTLPDPLSATGPESFQVVPQLFQENPTLSNWAPRLGLAWDPVGDGLTALRGGFGVFFDVPINGDLLDPILSAPPFVVPVQVNSPGFPDILGVGSDTLTPRLSPTLLEYGGFRWPYVMQFNVSLQREIWEGTVLSAAYSGSRGHHLISTRELNSRIPEILPTGEKYFSAGAPLKNPEMGGMRLKATDARSWYDSLELSLNRRFGGSLSLLTAYTFSKALDQAPPTVGNIETSGNAKVRMDTDDLGLDKGLSPFDVRHSLNASVLWALPLRGGGADDGRALWRRVLADWRVSGWVSLASGHPFTPLISFNRSRSGVTGSAFRADRPNLRPGFSNNPRIGRVDKWYDPEAFELPPAGSLGNLGRNTVIGPGFSNVDIALMRDFPLSHVDDTARLQLRLEVFNLLNQASFNLPGNAGNVSSGSFVFTDSSGRANLSATRPVATTNTPREIQLALRFSW